MGRERLDFGLRETTDMPAGTALNRRTLAAYAHKGLPRTFADDDERRPTGRVRIAAAAVDERQHGSAQGFRAADFGVGPDLAEGLRDQADRGARIHRPM